MKESIRVLFFLKSEEAVGSIKNELEKGDFIIVSERVSTCEGFAEALKTGTWDLIISDYTINQMFHTEALSLISEIEAEIPLIIISEGIDEAGMLELIDKGCSDCIRKDDYNRLRLSVRRVLKEASVYKSHKQALSEYLVYNRFLTDSLESIGDGVIMTDKTGKIIMINKIAQEYTGWLQQDAIGEPLSKVFSIINKISGLPAENPIDKVLRYGKASGLERNTVLVSKDLTERYVSASCAPIITRANELAGTIIVFRDITRIRKIENEVINEKKNLSVIFDAAPVGMLILDQNASIKKANMAIYKISGNEIINSTEDIRIGDIFNCPNRFLCEKGCGYSDKCNNCSLNIILSEACNSEKLINNKDIEYSVYINNNSEKVWLRVNSVSIIMDEQPHVLVIIDDITGLKKLQEELKESNLELKNTLEELQMAQNRLIQQEKLAGIGQLAAGVAHEINNPLGFVMSNFETLKKYISKYKKVLDAYSELKNELMELGDIDFGNLGKLINIAFLSNGFRRVRSKLDYINDLEKKENIHFISEDLVELYSDTREGLSRIGKIIMGLRMFSRVDQQNEMSEYDLNEGIQNTLIVANNEIKYYASVEADLQNIPFIYANGGQINQVLLNLIINAVHAIKSRDSEEMGLIRISTSCDDNFIYCSIEDNGIGIEECNINKIFDPFFTTKSVGTGTGLGLSISYDIITNKHGGELLVKSTKGVGSTFTIKLPSIA